MINLTEGQRIDFGYNRRWKDIPRDIFDKIIQIDPMSNLEQDKIGSNAEQLLLPAYLAGDTNFLENADYVKELLQSYLNNRNTYPAALKNIANFKTVTNFLDYMEHGEASEIARNDKAETEAPEEDKNTSPIDKFYKGQYIRLDRDIFDKIIALDDATSDTQIGDVAKDLLLPQYRKGEQFLDDPDTLAYIISLFNESRDALPVDRRNPKNYSSVADFVKFMTEGDTSSFLEYLASKTSDFNVLASTREYDVIQPTSWPACAYIVQKPTPQSPTDTAKLRWCTGYAQSDYYFRNYTDQGAVLICFIAKADPKNKDINYQLNLYQNGDLKEFLDGNDRNPMGSGSAAREDFWRTFLLANPEIVLAIKDKPIIKDNKTVKELALAPQYSSKEYSIESAAELTEFQQSASLKYFVKMLKISSPVIPPASFKDSPRLKKVTFENVEKISAQAFMNCRALKSIDLGEHLKEIGSESFADCATLGGSIKIPNSVEKIGREAFRGTHVTLAIDWNRKIPLEFAPQDKAWVSRHIKGITVQETLDEDLLLENIPYDLVQAYRKAEPAARGIQKHPESAHRELAQDVRKSKLYDYGRASYNEISKDQAWNIVKNDRENIDTLRFIVDGHLIEYELRGGTRFYQTYWAELSRDFLKKHDFVIKDLHGVETNDSRFLTSQSSIKKLIEVADKIYQTDEYEHLITPETKLDRKIKIIKVDSNNNPILDAAGNVTYEIVDDTIQNRRKRSQFSVYRTAVAKDNPDYDPHHPSKNFGGVAGSRIGVLDIPDTGAHEPLRAYGTLAAGNPWGEIDPDLEWNISPLESSGLRAEIISIYTEYGRALSKKKKAFKEYSYAQQRLKKLQQEEEFYQPEDFKQEIQNLQELVKAKAQAYQESLNELRKLKDKMLFNADDYTKALNRRIKKERQLLDDALTQIYQNEQKAIRLRGTNIFKSTDLSPQLAAINRQREDLRQNLEREKRRKEDMLARIQELQAAIAQSDISTQDMLDRIVKLQDEEAQASEEAMKKKFEKIDALAAETAKLEQELAKKFPQRVAAKKPEKEIDSRLADLISFGENADQPQSAE